MGGFSVSCDCKYMCFGTNLSLASGSCQRPVTLLALSLSVLFFSEQMVQKYAKAKITQQKEKKQIKEKTNRGNRRKTGDTLRRVKVTGRDSKNWGY